MGPSYETQFTVCYIYFCVITLVGIDVSNVGKTTHGCLRGHCWRTEIFLYAKTKLQSLFNTHTGL